MLVITWMPQRALRFMVWVPRGPRAKERITTITKLHARLIAGEI